MPSSTKCQCGARRRLWWHPNYYRPMCWSCLASMFASVGGLQPITAGLLGWRQSADAAANPVNVLLSAAR